MAYRHEHLAIVRNHYPAMVIMKSYEELGVKLYPIDIYKPFISIQSSYRECLMDKSYWILVRQFDKVIIEKEGVPFEEIQEVYDEYHDKKEVIITYGSD